MRFEIGRTVATPGALSAIGRERAGFLIARHADGDWGVINEEDAAVNENAVQHGSRILSAWPIDPEKPCEGFGENCVWIITEADRSATTVLLPEEY